MGLPRYSVFLPSHEFAKAYGDKRRKHIVRSENITQNYTLLNEDHLAALRWIMRNSLHRALRKVIWLLLGMLAGHVGFSCISLFATTLCASTVCVEKGTKSSTIITLNEEGSINESPRIFCYLNTFPKNYESRALHVRNTWARKCTEFVFTSTKSHPTIPIMKLNLTQPETRKHLWIKMQTILRQVYKHADHYDYFYKADDDTYVVYENLQKILQFRSPTEPFMTGYLWRAVVKEGYFSGGSGYVLSRDALKRVVEQAIDKHPKCPVIDEDKEDVKMSVCGRAVGVKLHETIGLDGRSVFYPYDVGKYAEDVLRPRRISVTKRVTGSRSCSQYLTSYHSWGNVRCNLPKMKVPGHVNETDKEVDRKVHRTPIYPHHVSFHYVNASKMYIMEFALYHLRPVGLK